MRGHNPTKKRFAAMAGTVAVGALLLGACSGEVRAERQGKQYGEAICDVKKAGSVDDAQRAMSKVQREAKDLQRIVGRPIEEDVRDIKENLSDLSQHVKGGNDALRQQDIAVITRNVSAIERTLSGKAKAAYDGIREGLAECDY